MSKRYINNVVENALNTLLFEKNDAETRSKICKDLVKCLTPHRKTFLVKCDEENNPPSIVDQNKICVGVREMLNNNKEIRYCIVIQ